MKYDYRFLPTRPDGNAEAVFKPSLPAKGKYEVQIMYSASNNRCTAADVTVVDKKGRHAIPVDMTRTPEVQGRWHSLGVFQFDPKGSDKVIFTNKGNGGVVIVDAVRFIKK